MEADSGAWPTTWFWLGAGDGESAWDKPEMFDNKTAIIVWTKAAEENGDCEA